MLVPIAICVMDWSGTAVCTEYIRKGHFPWVELMFTIKLFTLDEYFFNMSIRTFKMPVVQDAIFSDLCYCAISIIAIHTHMHVCSNIHLWSSFGDKKLSQILSIDQIHEFLWSQVFHPCCYAI